ncbi:MAG: hypothetical protein ABL928_12740 [Sphingorhabdus sp.]
MAGEGRADWAEQSREYKENDCALNSAMPQATMHVLQSLIAEIGDFFVVWRIAMPSERWSEEETKLALFLYFQLPYGKLHKGNPEIQRLADYLGRTHSSVAMKLGNFGELYR